MTGFLSIQAQVFPKVRVDETKRNFVSPAIEGKITQMQKTIKDPELAWMFGNCYPNTLDRTVTFAMKDGKPNTFVITGDIYAMWLRDCSAQVWPYMPYMKQDPKLQQLIAGVINRQAESVLIDPYANAYNMGKEGGLAAMENIGKLKQLQIFEVFLTYSMTMNLIFEKFPYFNDLVNLKSYKVILW